MKLLTLLGLLSLLIGGCGGNSGPYDPFQDDLQIVESSDDVKEKQAASQRLANQYVPDDAIDRMLLIVKDEKQDETVRAHIVAALGKIEPDRGNRLIVDLVEVGNAQPPGSPLAKSINLATHRLSQD